MKKVVGLGLALILAGFSFTALSEIVIPGQKMNQALHDQLPIEIRKSGEIISANNGSLPPYIIYSESSNIEGAAIELTVALSQILGVSINHLRVAGHSAVLMGIQSGRYHIAIGPIGDFPERQKNGDFIDYVQEYVVFGVRKGNPEGITSLNDTCGKRIAVMSGGSAERVIKQQSEVCINDDKLAISIQSFQDQPTSILALRANRTDAVFTAQAYLTYFVEKGNGELEMAAIGQKNGFGDLFQGAIVAKDSVLGPIILQAYQELFDNGTYALIMQKWGLENNMLKAPGINLAK